MSGAGFFPASKGPLLKHGQPVKLVLVETLGQSVAHAILTEAAG